MKYQQLKLFQEKEKGVIPREAILPITSQGRIHLTENLYLEVRLFGDFRGLSIYLPTAFDYVLGIDEVGAKILVVLKGDGTDDGNREKVA